MVFGSAALAWPSASGWQRLPELPATARVIVAADLQDLAVEGANGKIYACDTRRDGACWQIVEAVSNYSNADHCVAPVLEPPPAPAGSGQQIDVHICYADAAFSSSYVITPGGQVSFWEADATPYARLLALGFWPIVGCLVGVVIGGVGALTLFFKRRR